MENGLTFTFDNESIYSNIKINKIKHALVK